ncbi:MAG: type secretion system protein VirB10 [Sphingomonadales bacterium]|jgi:type IV secretion system protein VirB10|nr:type secretion system protein VirB10 [Sphingomonadales bacterium]
MARKPATDPRTLSPTPVEDGVRPVVALPRQGVPRPLLIALAVAAAVILFLVLDARRRSIAEPPQTAQTDRTGAVAPAPPLLLPPQQSPVMLQQPPQIIVPQGTAPAPRIIIPTAPPQRQPQIVYVPQPGPPQQMIPPPPARVATEPALVIDTTAGGPAAAAEAPAAAAGTPAADAASGAAIAIAGGRSRAGVLANRTTTVPQGTLIPAVMETAFNSTRPGLARAIVSQDVRGFDGRRVLIPRGSRLVGEYRADAAPGQRRAFVNWLRLIRPDGVTINIGSPATDPLGRGGIRANVNTHFFERFAGALLRSVVDVGITVAAGAANAPVLLLPGSGGGGLTSTQPQQVQPTLTVRQGRSISVFVARDLDFTGVDRRR